MEHHDHDSDAMFLGRVLRRARVAAGVTSQEELAKRLGFERTVIAKAESGRRPPSQEVAAAYAREFPQLNALIESGAVCRAGSAAPFALSTVLGGGVFGVALSGCCAASVEVVYGSGSPKILAGRGGAFPA